MVSLKTLMSEEWKQYQMKEKIVLFLPTKWGPHLQELMEWGKCRVFFSYSCICCYEIFAQCGR